MNNDARRVVCRLPSLRPWSMDLLDSFRAAISGLAIPSFADARPPRNVRRIAHSARAAQPQSGSASTVQKVWPLARWRNYHLHPLEDFR